MPSTLERISALTGITYSDEQLKILQHKGGMCILACAGSGKTSVLTHLIAKRILDGEIRDPRKLLVTTYSVAGREELEIRINKLLKALGMNVRVEIRTLHSAYRYMLQQIGACGQLIEGWKRTALLREGAKVNNIKLDDETLQKLDSLLSYQINNMLTNEALFKQYVYDIDLTPEQYIAISKYYNQAKTEHGVIDFDDMQLLVYTYLKTNADARNLFRNLWDDFYIDEFQDVSKIQFEILKMQLKDEEKLVVIGDDDQCIYAWRGADPSIIQNICGYYDINRFILSTNYRCGGEIVKHAAVAIANNTQRSDKTMNPYNEAGRIVLKNMPNSMYEMSVAACEYIKKLLEQGVHEEDIAILCRNNVHGVILDGLLQEFTQARTSNDIRFGTHRLVKELRTAVEISKGDGNFNHASQLWKLIPYLKVYDAKIIANIMRDYCCTLKMALKSILTNVFYKHIEDDTKDITIVNSTNYRHLSHTVTDSAVDGMFSFYKLLMLENENERAIQCIERYLSCTCGFLYKSEDVQRNLYGIADFMIALLEKGMDIYENYMVRAENYAKATIEPSRNCITLSTMHGSKGKEWKYVILLGDDNIAFPSFYTLRQLISEGKPIREISDYIEQERRLHYVAMTRAKEELRVYTTGPAMSVFLAEALGILTKKDSYNTHIIEIAKNGMYSQDMRETILQSYNKYSEQIGS